MKVLIEFIVKGVKKIQASTKSFHDSLRELNIAFQDFQRNLVGVLTGQASLAQFGASLQALGGAIIRFLVNPIGLAITAIAGLTAAFVKALKIGNEFAGLHERLSRIGASEESWRRLIELSNRYGIEIEALTDAFSQFYAVLKDENASITFIENLNRVAKGMGLTSENVKGLAVAFSQAFGIGALRGQELLQIMNHAPALASQMAEALGMSMGEFRQQMEQGKITTEKLLEAMDILAKKYSAAPRNIGEAWGRLTNAVRNAFGEFGRATGITQAITRWLTRLADAFISFSNAVARNAKKINLFFRILGELFKIVGQLARLTPSLFFTNFARGFGKVKVSISGVEEKLRSLYEKLIRFRVFLETLPVSFYIATQKIRLAFLSLIATFLEKIKSFLENKAVRAFLRFMYGIEVDTTGLTNLIIRVRATMDVIEKRIAKASDFMRQKLDEALSAVRQIDEASREVLQRGPVEPTAGGSSLEKLKGGKLEADLIRTRKPEFKIQPIRFDTEKWREVLELARMYRQTIEELNAALEAGAISHEEYQEKLQAYTELYKEAGVPVERILSGVKGDKFRTAIEELGQDFAQIFAQAMSGELESRQLQQALMNAILAFIGKAVEMAVPELSGLITPILQILGALFSSLFNEGVSGTLQQNLTVYYDITLNVDTTLAKINEAEFWHELVGHVIEAMEERTIRSREGIG